MSNAICQYISTDLDSPSIKLVWAKGNEGIALCLFNGKLYLGDVDIKTGSVFAGGYPLPLSPKNWKRALVKRIAAIEQRQNTEVRTTAYFGTVEEIN